MLTSEPVMNTNHNVTTVCHGMKREWDDREEALVYCGEAKMCCDSFAERSRYANIIFQLQNGLDYCTDEEG